MARLIDLRSDVVTQPTPAMRAAMLNAEVGDDVAGEDRTVNALQEKAAALFGKEAALFVTSGTQANQIAIKAYTQPGDEIVCDADCHPVRSEMGAAALISRVEFAVIPTARGVFRGDTAAAMLRDRSTQPRSALLWIENTHNAGGGTVFPLAVLEELRALSIERGVPLHMDGARLFNAVVASGLAPREWGRHCDSLSFCLSKGLGCPVGSLMLGSAEFIGRARTLRRMLGGGWRQAGILAAAGLHALDRHVERLVEDHANARIFADAVRGIAGVRLVYEDIPTNLVFLDVAPSGLTAEAVAARLRSRGVAIGVHGPLTLRAVTHLDVSRADVERAAVELRSVTAAA